MTQPYQITRITFDAARPWAVVATFRSFNRIIARYSDKAQAQRRARDMNKKSEWATSTSKKEAAA